MVLLGMETKDEALFQICHLDEINGKKNPMTLYPAKSCLPYGNTLASVEEGFCLGSHGERFSRRGLFRTGLDKPTTNQEANSSCLPKPYYLPPRLTYYTIGSFSVYLRKKMD